MSNKISLGIYIDTGTGESIQPRQFKPTPGKGIFDSFPDILKEITSHFLFKPQVKNTIALIAHTAKTGLTGYLHQNVPASELDNFQIDVDPVTDYNNTTCVDINYTFEAGPRLKAFLEQDAGRPLDIPLLFHVHAQFSEEPDESVYEYWGICPYCGDMEKNPKPGEICGNLHLPDWETPLVGVRLEEMEALELRGGRAEERIAKIRLG